MHEKNSETIVTTPKPDALDIVVTQRGDIYTVTGKDAPSLHAKMNKIPEEARTLLVSEMKDGMFTMQRMLISAAETQKSANA